MKINLALATNYPTQDEIENQFKIGRITFDQQNGIGEVPDNKKVMYFGFACFMQPQVFLSCVEPASHIQQRANIIETMILNGNSIASPFLELDMDSIYQDGIEIPKVLDHEGRARAQACYMIQPTKPILVHVFPPGLRARNLNKSLLKRVNLRIQRQSSLQVIAKPFDVMFWKDQIVD